MKPNPSQDDTKIVNASGFLFQLAVAHQIESTFGEHGWDLVSQEHPWRDSGAGTEGYIDLLLSHGGMRMVIECKRRREATWFFIVPSGHTREQSQARLGWAISRHGEAPRTGWFDCSLSPASPQSEFCLTRGTGEDDGNFLERICGRLLSSVDCVTTEELSIVPSGPVAVYVPVIITNADLKICKIDPSTISLAKGTASNPEFETVPIVRFRKSLTTSLTANAKPRSFQESSQDKERTVLVVNAGSLSTTLANWKINKYDETVPFPWETS
jgi:hypothetical protein